MPSVKRALVLGCGAVAGAAWSIPVLHRLQQELDWDAREADLLIGTSVGAVLTALLGAGVSVEQMLASQRGEATPCGWNHDVDSGGALPPRPSLRFPGLSLARKGLQGELSLLTALCGLLPAGRTDMQPFERLIEGLVPEGGWVPHPAAWMMAVDAHSGKRYALGRSDAPAVGLSAAVRASYAVPGYCPPVDIGGRTFLDGGVVSPTSADFVLGADVQEVVLLAPFASTQMDQPWGPLHRIERAVRRQMTRIVDAEVRSLRQAGLRVIRLEPGPEDLQAIGYNMLDPGRRERVFMTAVRTAPRTVSEALQASAEAQRRVA